MIKCSTEETKASDLSFITGPGVLTFADFPLVVQILIEMLRLQAPSHNIDGCLVMLSWLCIPCRGLVQGGNKKRNRPVWCFPMPGQSQTESRILDQHWLIHLDGLLTIWRRSNQFLCTHKTVEQTLTYYPKGSEPAAGFKVAWGAQLLPCCQQHDHGHKAGCVGRFSNHFQRVQRLKWAIYFRAFSEGLPT